MSIITVPLFSKQGSWSLEVVTDISKDTGLGRGRASIRLQHLALHPSVTSHFMPNIRLRANNQGNGIRENSNHSGLLPIGKLNL